MTSPTNDTVAGHVSAAYAALMRERSMTPRERACVQCGAPFMARSRGLYCSKACQRVAKKARAIARAALAGS